jgi:hypothetical protein
VLSVLQIHKLKKNRQQNGLKITKGGNQNTSNKEEQTTQWSKDNKGG